MQVIRNRRGSRLSAQWREGSVPSPSKGEALPVVRVIRDGGGGFSLVAEREEQHRIRVSDVCLFDVRSVSQKMRGFAPDLCLLRSRKEAVEPLVEAV